MSDDTTANEATLTEAERAALIFALSDAKRLGIGTIYNTVERILAARVAPLLAERDALRGKVASGRAIADKLHAEGWSQGPRYAALLRAALDAPAAAQPEAPRLAGRPCPIHGGATLPCRWCAAVESAAEAHPTTPHESDPA